MRQWIFIFYGLLILLPVSASANPDVRLHGIRITDRPLVHSVIADIMQQQYQREIIAADRYGRDILRFRDAQGEDVSIRLLQQGMALVWDDGFEMPKNIAAMFAAEADARAAKRGVWQTMQVLDANQGAVPLNEVVIVQGIVVDATRRNGNIYINFDVNWREDFTLFMGKERARTIDDAWLEKLRGKQVRMRGLTYNYYGPMMDILNPHMLEVVE